MKIKPKKISIEDVVNSKKNSNYLVKSRVLFAPNIQLNKFKDKNKYQCLLRVKKDSNSSEELFFLLKSNHDFVIFDSFWFPDFGVKLKTKRIEFDLGNSPCKAFWSIKQIKIKETK